MSAEITSMAVSLDLSDKQYGNGTNSFTSISCKWGENDTPTLDEVMDRGIDLYFTAWQNILVNRTATSQMTVADFKIAIGSGIARIEKVKQILNKIKSMNTDEVLGMVRTEKAKVESKG
jgi:hypothetical protein